MVGKVLKWGSCHFTFWQIWLGEKMQKMIAHHAFSKLFFLKKKNNNKKKRYFHSFKRNYNENSKHKTNKD
jgi:uncharacterized membrane protein SirB2